MADKYIILGVSFDWGTRKGLDVFVELSKRLDKELYKIVLVGVDRDTVSLPDSIVTVERTDSREDLAALYSAADVFVNPTREDNYPTVNMEAIACGTPVITFDTGGSPETVGNSSGIVVQTDDIDEMQKAIEAVCLQGLFKEEELLYTARSFDKWKRYGRYLELYDGSQD